MAIFDACPGIDVKVTVRGQPLQEYDDDDSPAPKTYTKYIEARSGEEFAISAAFTNPFPDQYDIAMHLNIDGVKMATWYRKRDKLFHKALAKNCIHFQQDGEWMKQKFCFAALDIVEEARGPAPTMATLKQALNAKGCITVSFEFLRDLREVNVENKPRKRKELLTALDEIPEKALKGDALSHQVVLSEPQKVRNRGKRNCHSYSVVDDAPFLTVHFKYRSIASLRALRLIADDETPPIPLEDRPEEDLSPAELRELLRRVRQRDAEGGSVKQEAETTARVKRERVIDDGDDVKYVETRQRKRPNVEHEVIVID